VRRLDASDGLDGRPPGNAAEVLLDHFHRLLLVDVADDDEDGVIGRVVILVERLRVLAVPASRSTIRPMTVWRYGTKSNAIVSEARNAFE